MFIYGLYSTENSDKIRYIGKTKCSLSKRLNEHLNGALKRNCNTHKDNWIRDAYRNGYKVNIKLVEECDDSNWEERERYWIKNIEGLTNLTDGGDGGHGDLYNVSYNEMKKYISTLKVKIRSIREFNNNTHLIDKKYPKNPYEYFSKKGEWISWGDFLSTGKIQDNKKAEKYLTYIEAKRFLKKKKFRYMKNYHEFIRNEKIDFLPYRADRFYANKGWKSWMDFLGTVKRYEITEELLKRYMKKNFPNINSNHSLAKRFHEINNALRFKYFSMFNWNN